MTDGPLDHFPGNIAAELSDLFPDASEESIAGPVAKQHDGADWDAIQTHGHGS